MKVATARQMAELDRVTIEQYGIPSIVLMENAGRSCTERILRILEEKVGAPEEASVAVVCGRGNNGGDGFVIARHLHNRGVYVEVFILSEEDRLSPDALADALAGFVRDLGVDIVGGCCGTTPEHLRKVVERVRAVRAPRRARPRPAAELSSAMKAVPLAMEPRPLLVGERLNAQGSRKVKELLLADDYPGLLQIARGQVEAGYRLDSISVFPPVVTVYSSDADLVSRLPGVVETQPRIGAAASSPFRVSPARTSETAETGRLVRMCSRIQPCGESSRRVGPKSPGSSFHSQSGSSQCSRT